MSIATRLPPTKKLLHQINARLKELHETGVLRHREICRFKAGDRRAVYEPYPKTISYETLQGTAYVRSTIHMPSMLAARNGR